MSPNLAASIRARLLNAAKAQGVDFNQVLVRFTLERILYRLGQSRHADRFLLKGALLFTLWYDMPHCHTHVIPRLKSVIDATDSSGITASAKWIGGGGFRYFGLAPTLIVNDRWGNPIINPEYNAAQLAEALAKLEGFAYAPSETLWWQHGHSSERDFIYVTTQNLSADQLQALSEEVGAYRSLLICCSAFRGVTAAQAGERWPNLTLKKIPKMVLARCEWGHDDYSLNVANLPMAKPSPVDASAATEANKKTRSRKAPATNLDQDGLFGENE